MNKPIENNLHEHRTRTEIKAAMSRRKRTPIQTIVVLSGVLIILAIGAALSFVTSSSASSKKAAADSEFNSLFVPVDGTITIKAGNYIGTTSSATTETATFTKQIFSSSDCSTGGGSIDTITGVDSTTGHSFTLGSGSSVQITIPESGIYFAHVSEQNGPFVGFQVADNSYQSSITAPGDGHQVCIQGFDGPDPRTYLAQFYAGIELFDSCGNERYSFRPGETMTIKVSGGLTHNVFPLRLLSAGGSVNECTFLPSAPDFTPVPITSDPFTYDFTLPSSDAEISPSCASGNTTSILGNWRVVAFDSSCSCNRNDVKFTLAEDAPQPGCADGTVTIKSGNYIGTTPSATTQTATFTKQIFSSNDCSGTGGSIDTVTGVDSTTGHSFPLGAGSSVQVTIPDSGPGPFFSHLSEQNGLFVAFQPEDNSYLNSIIYAGDGHQVCIQGFNGAETRTYRAQFYAGIQLFDACGNERDSFRPGETITFKVSGGLTHNVFPLRLLSAGGSVNECTFLPSDLTPVNITSDPFTYEFTLPDSDADIPASCVTANNTTSILGDWRVVAFDSSCGCNRAQTRFTVANDAPQPGCAMTCPADITVSNDPGSCGAVVNYTPPTVGPSAVTCDFPTGSTFPVGPTLVTCTSNAGPSCSFNVTVNDTQSPTITAPADSSATANSSCQAAIPNVVSGSTSSDNCGSVNVTQDPAAGTLVGLGPHTITLTATDSHGLSSMATTTFTVNAPQLTALGSAQVWIGLKNSDDVGTKFDLLAEVLKGGSVIGSGQINGVPGGSSGFNNAIQRTIAQSLSGSTGFCGGNTLSIRLSVRVAANSGHVSGTARLWFNDAAANSRFTATINGSTNTYYLRSGFVLATTAGPGPKSTIDVLVNRNQNGNPFKPFGTWNITF